MNIKGSIFIFIMFIVLVCGVFGTWYFMEQNLNKQLSSKDRETSELEKQILDLVGELNELKSDDSSTSSIDTSNWLDYKNSKLDFSFKYPAEFALTQNDLVSGPNKTTTGSKALILKNSTSQQEPQLTVWVNYAGEGQVADYYFELSPTAENDGVDVSTIKEHPKTSESDPDLVEYVAYTTDKVSNLNLFFGFSHKPGDDSFQKIFESILKSILVS